MMPESLLNELKQTAQDVSVEVALVMAYQAGQCCELREHMESIRRARVDNSLAMKNLDMHLQSRGGCYDPEI